MSVIADRVHEVTSRIEASAGLAGRDPAAVKLIAATKSASIDQIAEVIQLGVTDLGENRAQELLTKAPELLNGLNHPDVHWHFIGALQRNKVKSLVPWIDLWQSVDRIELGATLARVAPTARVLVEVNLASEAGKAGCDPQLVPSLVNELRRLGLIVEGLMAIPPARLDPVRHFAALRILAESLDLAELSMGMSDDFELAISEGATMVRVGRGLFGDRSQLDAQRR